MSGLLFDTHALLWWMSNERFRIGESARPRLEADAERVAVSAVSIWETSIKRALGKLQAPADMLERVSATGLELLSISAEHADLAGSLPLHHRDPFDRLLVAQAQIERLALVTEDRHLAAYGIEVVW